MTSGVSDGTNHTNKPRGPRESPPVRPGDCRDLQFAGRKTRSLGRDLPKVSEPVSSTAGRPEKSVVGTALLTTVPHTGRQDANCSLFTEQSEAQRR